MCFHSSFSPRFWTSPGPKPALGPEFPAPLNPMLPEALFLRPLLSRNQPVPAVYIYFASPSCSLTPLPVSLCGPHNLVVPHLRLRPFFLMCKGALGFVLRMPESIVRFNSVHNSLRSSLHVGEGAVSYQRGPMYPCTCSLFICTCTCPGVPRPSENAHPPRTPLGP